MNSLSLRSESQSRSSNSLESTDTSGSGRWVKPERVDDLLWRLSTPSEKRQLQVEQQLDDDVLSPLKDAAADPEKFEQMVRTAFGQSVSTDNIESLRQSLLDGSFEAPDVVLSNAATLGTASGAYDAKANTIYLDQAVVGSDAGAATLAEELGHALDTRLNVSDARGDEGAIFSRLLSGESINQNSLTALRAENDHGEIVIDGRRLAVEFRDEGGYTGSDYPWNPGGVALSPPARSSSTPEPAASPAAPRSVGYTGSDYPWNPGGAVFNPPARPPAPPEPTARVNASITFATHFEIFDNPQGGTDNRSTSEDIEEIATGDFDVDAINQRLLDSGVAQEDLAGTRADIVQTANLIRNDDEFRIMLDVAGDEPGAKPDYHFSIADAEAAMMTLTVDSSHPRVLAAREQVIRRAVADEFARDSDVTVFEAVLSDDSRLGVLTEREERMALDAALDTWMPRETHAMRAPHQAEHLLTELAQGPDGELYERIRSQYIARSVALVNTESPEQETGANGTLKRQEAATLASSVFYSTYGDTQATRDLFADLTEPTALALADALALDRTDSSFNSNFANVPLDTRAYSAVVAIAQLEPGAASVPEQAFVRAVFTSLPARYQSGLGDEVLNDFHSQVGFALTSDLSDQPIARGHESARLADILGTSQGLDLLAFNENRDIGQRATALALTRENAHWTAETFTLTDSVWSNPAVMHEFARPRAQAYLDHRGDTPVIFRGSALENQIGTAVGLAPDSYPQGESAADIAAREQAVANGEFSYFENEYSAGIIAEIAEEIRAVGGVNPAVTIVPVQYSSDQSGVQELVIFRVVDENDPSVERFVDATGAYFTDIEDWRADNQLPPGYYTLPTEGRLTRAPLTLSGAGIPEQEIMLEGDVTRSTVDTWQEHATMWLDRGVAAGALVAGGAILIGSGGTAAPFVIGAAGAYGAVRAGDRLVDRYTHHRPLRLDDPGARRDWLDLGLGVVGFGSGAALFRTARLAQSATPLANLGQWANIASRTNQLGSALDAASAANDGYSLVTNWDELDGNQRASMALNIAFWSGAGLAQHRIGRSASQSAGDPAGLYDTDSLRYQWLDAHQDTNWRSNSSRPAEYRWTDTVPPIRAGHVIEGHLRYNNSGSPIDNNPGTGYHHRAGGVDAEWHRTTITSTVDANGLYQGSVEFWDPLSRSWLPKRADSTFFPDSFSEAQVHQAIQEAYIDAGSPGANANQQFTGTTESGFDINFRVGKVADASGNLVPGIVSAYPVFTP